MKIFLREQLAQIDRRTRDEEPIAEIDLMERASMALVNWFVANYSVSSRLAVIAGPGNNGGDALAVARILAGHRFPVTVYLPELDRQRSEASQINLDRLKEMQVVPVFEMDGSGDLPDLSNFDLLVDGLYGSGLNRPLEGFVSVVIDWMNDSHIEIVSIDLPSGLLCDENSHNTGAIVRASYTLTLESPKLSLFFKENEPYFGIWKLVKFGLSQKAMDETPANYLFLEEELVATILKKRTIFSHKGSYGHGLLIAGSKGKMGAAQLSSRGALRAGIGLLTVHTPQSAGVLLQISLPEAMSSYDQEVDFVTELPVMEKYHAVAAGPGLGTHPHTAVVIRNLIEQARVPLVLDADALNILAANPAWLKKLPAETILSPHPVEFDRLAGLVQKSEEERLATAQQFAISYGVVLVLKGAFTRILFPDGTIYFNSTGNPGMATAGSGDVLTGMLLGLLGQGYSPRESALLGVFLHGRSADLRVASTSEESLIASEIADYLGDAFASLK